MIYPVGLFWAVAWFCYLLSRLLWCFVRKPAVAKLLAVLSSIGPLVVLFAVFYGWNSGKSFSDILLLPMTIACAAIAWLGLASDWLFVRILHPHLFPSQTEHSLIDNVHLDATAALNESNKRTIFSGMTKREDFLFWILVIIGLVMILFNEPLYFGKVAVIAPLILQVWAPVKKALVDEIISSMTHAPKGVDQPLAEQV